MQSEEQPRESNEQSSEEHSQNAGSANSSHGDEGEEHEPSFRDFIISYKTMEAPLRALTAIMVAEVVSSALFILAKSKLFPSLTITTVNLTFTVPWPSYVASGMIVLLGLYLLTQGTIEASVTGRLLFVGVLLAFFSACILGSFVGNPVLLLVYLYFTIFYCGAGGALPRLYQKRYSPERQSKAFIWTLTLGGLIPGVFLLVAAPPIFSNYLVMLWMPLLYIFFLAGTDWAEILDAIARSLLKHNVGQASSGWLAGLGIALCCGFAWWMTRGTDGAAWRYVPAMAGAVLYVAVIMLLARVNKHWSTNFSWAGLAILIATFGLLIGVGFQKGAGTVAPVWPVCFSVAVGALLILLTRWGKFEGYWPVLLFGVIMATFWAVVDSSRQGPQGTAVRGGMLGIATASLLGIAALLWLWKSGADVRKPLFNTIMLNIGCMALYSLFDLYERMREASDEQRFVAATVVLVAICWDIIISGHALTNVDGKMFSRRSRVFLFFGYICLVTATVVFWSSVDTDQVQAKAMIKALGDPEMFVQEGISLFGPATLLTLFVLRLGAWLPGRREQAALSGHG